MKENGYGPCQARSNSEIEYDVAPILTVLDKYPAHLGAVQLQAELELYCMSELEHSGERKARAYRYKTR